MEITVQKYNLFNNTNEIVTFINYWKRKLDIEHYHISLEKISESQVCDDNLITGNEFVGIYTDHKNFRAYLLHTRELYIDDIVHELLHVKYPEWTDDRINEETENILMKFNEKGGENMAVTFYNVKTRKPVVVQDDDVNVITFKNGKKAAQAEFDGSKLFKILNKDDAARLTR